MFVFYFASSCHSFLSGTVFSNTPLMQSTSPLSSCITNSLKMPLTELQTNPPPDSLTLLSNQDNPHRLSKGMCKKGNAAQIQRGSEGKAALLPFHSIFLKMRHDILNIRACLDMSMPLWLMRSLCTDTFLLGKLHLHEYRLLLYGKTIHFY